MSNVITDAMNIATENQHKIDNLYGVLNNYKLSKKNKGYENDHSNKSLKDIKEVLTSTDMGEVANTTAEAEPTDLVFGAKSPVVYKEELGDLEATYNTIPGSATGTKVNAACYGNGTIIVIPKTKSGSSMRKVYYSTDEGITWTEGNMPSYQVCNSVCYGKDKFVAVAYNSNVFAYSTDGITWSKGTLPSTTYWHSVCYGKDKFVAVSYTSNIFAYSLDGITWTQGTMPSTQQWYSVCYGKDKFVAVAYNTILFAYSLDGITWTQGALPGRAQWNSVCYGKDKFVAVAPNNDTDVFVYSTDGITWTQGTLPVAGHWYSVCYGNNKFVAAGYNSNIFAYSLDGITWTDGKLTYSTAKSKDFSDLRIVVPTSTGFMLFGASDSEIQYWKVDEVVKPIAFKQGNLLSNNYWSCICYGKDKFVALVASKARYTFAYSLDGITWTEGTLPAKYWWNSVCYGKDKFVAVAPNNDTDVFVYSTDGITWTSGTLPIKGDWVRVCYGKDKFVAIIGVPETFSNVFAYSLDGITWTQGTLPSTQVWMSICYGKDKFVAVAYNSDVFAYSSDGITWTQGNMPSTQYWDYACYGKDKFVAIAFNSDVFAYSLDGITWTQGTLPSTQYWDCVCYGKDKFVAIANTSDIFAYSLDGITWTQGTLPSTQVWMSICYGKDKFVAVSNNSDFNAFIYSYDLPVYNNYAYHESALPADIGLSRNIEFVLIPDGNSNVSAYGSFNDSIITSSSPNYTLVSTDLSIKDILNSHGSSTGNYLASTTSIETVDSNNYLNSTNVYTIDPTTYETAKVSSWDICKYIGDNKRPLMNNYRKIYAIKPIKNGMHKFFGWVYLDTHKCRLEVIFTKDFINYYTLLLGVGDTFFANGLVIPGDTDVSNITDTQITKAVQKYLSILPDNTIVYMNFSHMILKGSDPYKEDPAYPAEMCNIIDPFSNTQEVKSANNRITFMTIRDDYGTGDYQNKAFAGISAYLNDNGEIVVHYNNRSETPLTIYNGRVMNNTPYSTKYTNYSKEVIASPKVAKLFGSATTDTTNNISTFKTSINNMSMDLAITTVDSKDNTKNANVSYLPAASVSLAIGDVSDRIYNNEDERFKHFNKVALFVNEAIENMDNIDIDFSDYIETTAIDRDSVVKDGKNDKEYKKFGNVVQGTLPSKSYWSSVCYGKDKFVMLSNDVFAYSSDGITWTEGTLPAKASWKLICYGKDKFVAMVDNDRVSNFIYSSDGITWTEGTLPKTIWADFICYGNDKFIMMGSYYSAHYHAYSTDGISWTFNTASVINNWTDGCYGKDKFVVITITDDSDDTTARVVCYSFDGITWLQGKLPAKVNWYAVCYGKDKFVAVANGPNDVFAYSSDGITWTQGTMPSKASWTYMCYGDGKFVTVTVNSNKFAYSSDGITWTQGTMPSSYWANICYGDGKFIFAKNNSAVYAFMHDADPMFITSKIYNFNTLEINNRSENTDSNLRYRATVIGNTLLPDKFHMNNPRFTPINN